MRYGLVGIGLWSAWSGTDDQAAADTHHSKLGVGKDPYVCARVYMCACMHAYLHSCLPACMRPLAHREVNRCCDVVPQGLGLH